MHGRWMSSTVPSRFAYTGTSEPPLWDRQITDSPNAVDGAQLI